MQILHPFTGSIQQYSEAISDPDLDRPDHCPQCEAKQSLIGHGFYRRTLVDPAFDGVIHVRRYPCRLCKRTVSLLPEFALPWLRFSLTVISLFLVARLLRGLTLVAAALAASQAAMPYQRGQFWIRRSRKQAPTLGVALAPQPRQDRGQSRTITPQLADLIERLKRENPHRTGTTLLRELALSSGHNEPAISASTLYRFLKQRGLTERQLLAPPARKKFEAEYSNQIWQSDMLYGPYVRRPGGGKMQALLHAVLDDASRLIPHAQFYTKQSLDVCLDCLRQAIAARGVPVRLYMDNAKIYRSPQLARIAASIGMLIVHTPPYQPEGRGKIERFFRSAREQFLNNLDRKQTLSLEELNERLWAWVDVYHRTEHSSLGTTPLLRWQRDIEHIRQLPPATDFRRLFFHRLDRLVRRDCTFQLQNRFYEAPPHLVNQTIEARFDPLDPAIMEIYFQGKPEGAARLVDPVVNAQLPSAKSSPAKPEPTGINFVDLLIQKKNQEE